jgi:hypothetical protein
MSTSRESGTAVVSSICSKERFALANFPPTEFPSR